MVYLNISCKMLNQQHLCLNSIDTYFEPLLKRVLQEDKLGIHRGVIKLNSASSSCGRAKADRFDLLIPYADQHLIWNVLFDSQYPELGPDFRFIDDSFLTNSDVDTLSDQLPSLVKWDSKNANSLLNVLKELLFYYKKYQIELLANESDFLHTQFEVLSAEVAMEDIEVILLPLGSKPMEVRFCIRLEIDYSQLPPRDNPSQDYAVMLLVKFHGPDWNSTTPELYLSKSLEDIFSGTDSITLFPFTSHPWKNLCSYVNDMKKLIEEKINNVVQSYENRKRFISALLTLQRGSVLEYDAKDFREIVILLEHKDFYFLVHFNLPLTFPKDQPLVTLRSIYHMTSRGKLYSETLDYYPYSPRWEPQHMIIRILRHIIEKVSTFQTCSIKINRF